MKIELGLDKIKKLLFLLGNPEKYLKVIHVAGTNGKGSVISYLYSILMKKDLKIGRYISPAVFDELEIIQINGVNIERQEYDALMNRVDEVAAKMTKEPSMYEKQTVVAILYFVKEKCDVCIIETGLGGSLDATNVFRKALCSIITSVDFDHTEYLGESINEIAEAKAGIIKSYSPIVLAPQKYSEVFDVVQKKAADCYATVLCVDKNGIIDEKEENGFSYKAYGGKVYEGIKPKNKALYQRENICTAIEVINILNYYEYKISDEEIVDGINEAVWSGRFEQVNNEPIVYIDGAHNPNGAERLKETILQHFSDKKLTLVMGVFKDKDYKQIAEIMAPLADKMYTFTPENERGLSGEELRKEIALINSNVENCEQLQKALDKAVLDKDNIVIVFGSLSYLKDVKGYFLNEDR